MDTKIKQLAEQAGYLPDMFGIGHWDMWECKRFYELVRQDEREACAEHYLGIMRDAVTEARKDEREACAVIADRYDNGRADNAADLIANEIRQRGEK